MAPNIGEELERALSSGDSKPDAGISRRLIILSYLSERPCSTSTMLARFIGTSERGILWHTDALLKKGIIGRNEGKKARFFIKDHIKEEDCPVFSILIDERVRKLLLLMEEEPGMSFSDMLQESLISEQVLRRELKVMEESGIITHMRDGRMKRYYITERLSLMKKEYEERSTSTAEMIKDAISELVGSKEISSERENMIHVYIASRDISFNTNPFTAVFSG